MTRLRHDPAVNSHFRPQHFMFSHGHDDSLALQTQRGAVDQTCGEKPTRASRAGLQRGVDFGRRQLADIPGDKARAEIAVGLQIMRRAADDGGMAGQIDGVGDDGGGGVGL